jgi:hypothetical protein
MEGAQTNDARIGGARKPLVALKDGEQAGGKQRGTWMNGLGRRAINDRAFGRSARGGRRGTDVMGGYGAKLGTRWCLCKGENERKFGFEIGTDAIRGAQQSKRVSGEMMRRTTLAGNKLLSINFFCTPDNCESPSV